MTAADCSPRSRRGHHRRGRPARRPAERGQCRCRSRPRSTLIEALADGGPAGGRGGRVRLAQMGAADGRQRRGAARGCAQRPGVRYPVLVPNLQGARGGARRRCRGDRGLRRRVGDVLAARTSTARSPRASRASGRWSRRRVAAGHARAWLRLVRGRLPLRGRDRAGGGRRASRASWSEMGCFEISLGDTIGVGTPRQDGGDARGGHGRACRSARWRSTPTTPTARRWPTS